MCSLSAQLEQRVSGFLELKRHIGYLSEVYLTIDIFTNTSGPVTNWCPTCELSSEDEQVDLKNWPPPRAKAVNTIGIG